MATAELELQFSFAQLHCPPTDTSFSFFIILKILTVASMSWLL